MNRPVCAIVGAGEGLGRALAAKFAGEGYDLALVSRSATGSEAAVRAARAGAPAARVEYCPGDASDAAGLEAALAGIGARLGPVEILIYNASSGYKPCAPLAMTYEDLESRFRLEIVAAFAAAKAVMPGMIARGRGTVLFSSATAAFRGSATNPLYAIGKFGLRGLAQSLGKAHARDGVHVAHLRIDAMLDVPSARKMLGEAFKAENAANTDDVAQTYWWVHCQPKSAWSNEVELRPYTENWTF
jgi:short-subunit dehydrogenase